VSWLKSFADSLTNSLAFKYFKFAAAAVFDFVIPGTITEDARIAFTCKKRENKNSSAVDLDNLIYFGVRAKIDNKLIFPKFVAKASLNVIIIPLQAIF
jgi:hypothetical protein